MICHFASLVNDTCCFTMVRSIAALVLFISQPVFAADYGVDVSYPIHHANTSKNYAWLPHNLDPSLPVPPEYEGMVIQPLGEKQTFYDNLINGCREYYGNKGDRCDNIEEERVAMSLRQPKGMVVSLYLSSLVFFYFGTCAHYNHWRFRLSFTITC